MLRHCVSLHNHPNTEEPQNKLNHSSNYRGITLGSPIGKAVDNFILGDNVNILKSSDLDFGFKPKHSTTQCTFVLNEIIDYYIRQYSSV